MRREYNIITQTDLMIVRIALSLKPFWWWDSTTYVISDFFLSRTLLTKSLSEKHPLSALCSFSHANPLLFWLMMWWSLQGGSRVSSWCHDRSLAGVMCAILRLVSLLFGEWVSGLTWLTDSQTHGFLACKFFQRFQGLLSFFTACDVLSQRGMMVMGFDLMSRTGLGRFRFSASGCITLVGGWFRRSWCFMKMPIVVSPSFRSMATWGAFVKLTTSSTSSFCLSSLGARVYFNFFVWESWTAG